LDYECTGSRDEGSPEAVVVSPLLYWFVKRKLWAEKKQSPVVLLKKMSPPQLLMQGGWVSSLKKKYDTENKRKEENSKFAFQRIETGFGCLVRIRIDRHVQHRACEENQTKN